MLWNEQGDLERIPRKVRCCKGRGGPAEAKVRATHQLDFKGVGRSVQECGGWVVRNWEQVRGGDGVPEGGSGPLEAVDADRAAVTARAKRALSGPRGVEEGAERRAGGDLGAGAAFSGHSRRQERRTPAGEAGKGEDQAEAEAQVEAASSPGAGSRAGSRGPPPPPPKRHPGFAGQHHAQRFPKLGQHWGRARTWGSTTYAWVEPESRPHSFASEGKQAVVPALLTRQLRCT